jgi:hypothetical protein
MTVERDSGAVQLGGSGVKGIDTGVPAVPVVDRARPLVQPERWHRKVQAVPPPHIPSDRSQRPAELSGQFLTCPASGGL